MYFHVCVCLEYLNICLRNPSQSYLRISCAFLLLPQQQVCHSHVYTHTSRCLCGCVCAYTRKKPTYLHSKRDREKEIKATEWISLATRSAGRVTQSSPLMRFSLKHTPLHWVTPHTLSSCNTRFAHYPLSCSSTFCIVSFVLLLLSLRFQC